MVEVILGVTTACCSGKTTASAVATCEISPRFAGAICTETSGVTSASLFEQPERRKSGMTAENAGRQNLRGVMGWSELRSEFADWRERRDSARRRPDNCCWLARRQFASRQLPGQLLHRPCSAKW